MTLPDPRKALEQIRKGPETDEGPLPSSTIVTIDVKNGPHHYQGRWRFTVPTLGMKIEIGKLKTLYMPMGSGADAEAAGIVEVLAVLAVCCQPVDEAGKASEPPGWWDPINARDFLPYGTLYQEVMSYDRRFRGEGATPRHSRDARGAHEEAAVGGRVDGADDGGVGSAVPAAPERRTTLATSRKRGP